ncbi:hypothetical protein LOAG_03656 [Loa loa]|uniref:Uncharacterized protein n=1 Tax=Loa loa TaxID=7209 RepID=A0A1S0U3X2_LOALO|nr:hypothetical protein LOAG_03656 [Loa loa]EFO24827.1 hypothetical protein LOAG_03656 [Loa loa]
MPREACEFCRRARARHKTRKKAGVFWYSSRGMDRAGWKRRTRFRQKSSAIFAVRDNKHGTNEVDKQDKFEINPRLQALVDLFKKEGEVEEVLSPKDSASILSGPINDVEIIPDSLQSSVLNNATNEMLKGTVPVVESRSTEKPSLVHFKISETTLQQCADLLNSLSTPDQCMENS